jgi:L-aspartate oxidase
VDKPSTPRAVVVGSGLAGLECGLGLAAVGWTVEILSPGRPGHDGATHRVHALAPWILLTAPWVRGDSPERLLADLNRRGEGMARDGLADALAAGAHDAARRLMVILDLEPLDSRPALLPGDEVPRGMRCLPRGHGALLAPLLARCVRAGVVLRGRTLAIGLLVRGDRAAGVVAFDRAAGRQTSFAADAVFLACGGPGAVFPVATEPRWCRGSAIALASAAGALLHRPELTQALPVTATRPLYFPTSAALVSGRVRIDGRVLAPAPDLETATRQIAAALQRGATVSLETGDAGELWLPARVLQSAAFRTESRVPLTLALHHGVGGVAIDSWGRTSLPGLYACGEAAGGIQGRRRMMGTGLVEAVIFAGRAAKAASHDMRPSAVDGSTRALAPPIPVDPPRLEERLDVLLAPLVTVRGGAAVAAALGELEGWPTRGLAAADERGALAALRLRAAIELLAGERRRGSEAAGAARGEADAPGRA